MKSAFFVATVAAACILSGCEAADANTSELETRISDLEAAVAEAKQKADEAHELAEDAKSKAEEACQPHSLQFGCPAN